MKKISAVILAMTMTSAFGQVHVNGYTKKDGTYVAPHERTAPNDTNLDNYSTKGNINPYTGKEGTKQPEAYGYPLAQPVLPAQPTQARQAIEPIQPIQLIKPLPSNRGW